MSPKMEYNNLSTLEKFIVRRSHPMSLITLIIGLAWLGYFLWLHQLILAVICIVIASVSGEILIKRDKKFDLMLQQEINSLQQLMVYHAGIKNLIFLALSLLIYLAGCWHQSFGMLLLSFSIASFGHIFPWIRHRHETYYTALKIDTEEKAESEKKTIPPV